MTIFSIFIFVLILMISGMAVDLMQHETRRVKLQTTLDAAVLAAASENQTQDPELVINEYLTKAGIDATAVEIDTYRIDGETRARVSANVATNTIFMNMMGIDTLSSPSFTDAVERVTKIEISMVLDFTSSMKNGGRLDALISAVDDFVNVVYQIDCSSGTCTQPDPDTDITVNVVPYGGTVNPGTQMASMMGLQRWHGFSSCAEMPANTYNDTTLPYGSVLQVPHFYIWNRADASQRQEFGWCPQDDNTILYASSDPQQIKDYVRTLELNDGTGSDVGMKWGMALLDPSSRDEINTINDTPDATFPEDFANNILKVTVLMTDGGITFQSHPLIHEYEWFYDPEVLAQKPNDLSGYTYEYEWLYDPALTDPFVADRLDAFERFGSLNMANDQTLELNGSGNAQFRNRSEVETSETRNTRFSWRDNHKVTLDEAIENLEAQCGLAKTAKDNGDEQVSVYTVQFMDSRQWITDYMQPCASNENQYFFVNDNQNLSNIFASIANHINNRKLSLAN